MQTQDLKCLMKRLGIRKIRFYSVLFCSKKTKLAIIDLISIFLYRFDIITTFNQLAERVQVNFMGQILA